MKPPAVRDLLLFRAVGDRLGEANTLQATGDVLQFQKDMDGALARYDQALLLFRAAGDRQGEAHTLGGIAQVKLVRGFHVEAGDLLERAISIYGMIGDRYSIAAQTGNYGWALRRAGKPALARPYLLRAADLFEKMGWKDYAERYRRAAEEP